MSNTVKSRFAGMFFGWRRHVDNKDAGAAPPEPRLPGPPVSSRPPGDGGELDLPLQPILEKLPPDLRARITRPAADLANARVSIALEQILPQLATGSVKISFGQLREAMPDLFRVGAEYDALPVTVPLNEVLSRLNPKWFARSAAQRAVQVSDDITSPFSGPKRQIVSDATPRLANRVPPSNIRLAPSFVQAPVAPAPAVSASAPVPGAATPRQTVPPAAMKTAPVPAPTPGPIIAPLAALSEHWPDPMRAEIAQLNLAGAEIALPFDMVQSALKRGQAVFPWRTLRAWLKPAPVLAVSVRDNLELSLPLKIIVPLFMGRCTQPARKIQPPIQPAEIPDLISLNPRPSPDEPAPKPVAAPATKPVSAPAAAPVASAATMAAPAPAAPAAPLSNAPVSPVSRAVAPPVAAPTNPVFAPAPSNPANPAPIAPVLPVARASAPAVAVPQQPAAAAKPAFKMADAKPLEVPAVRRATPAEVVKRAMALPGVAGVILALPDGLSVSSQAPDGVDADMLAAFVPQIFDRAGQGAAELRMGELNRLAFTVGNVPWMILRGSMVYFAAFGRAGEALPPAAQLSALAAELDRKNPK